MDIQDGVRRRSQPLDGGAAATATGGESDRETNALVLSLLSDLAAVEDDDELIRNVLMRAVVETASDRGVISWIEGDEMVVAACYDPFGELVPAGSRWPLAGDESSQVAPVLAQLAGSETLSPGLRDTYASLRHLAVAPVSVAGEHIAVLCVSRRHADQYSARDQRRLELVSLAAARPLEATRLRAQLSAARQELGEHTERTEALERVKTDILRLASHELRTPLTVLNGYLSLVDDGFFGEVPDPLRQVVELLQRRTAEMNSLVNGMLVAVRVEETATAAAPSRTDLRDVVRAAVDGVQSRATHLHRLHLDLPDDEVAVVVDADRLTLAIRNLVDNALKYSPAGGDVACRLEVAGDRAVVRIEDHGLGIDPADRDKLFTRFGRILTTENSHIPGIGLGLYFTREVARRHGGDVCLVASDTHTTVFELSVPLVS